MKGLLYKDFVSTKKETCLCLGVCLIFLVFAFTAGSMDSATMAIAPAIGVMVAFGAMAPTYSLQYDKNSGWNRFVCASPTPRDKVILAKYAYGVVDAVVFSLFAALSNLLTGSGIPMWSTALLTLVILVLQAVMLPICLKFGQNASLVAFLSLVFVPIILGVILTKAGIITDAMLNSIGAFVASLSPALLLLTAAILALLLYFISYCICCRIFRKMEF